MGPARPRRSPTIYAATLDHEAPCVQRTPSVLICWPAQYGGWIATAAASKKPASGEARVRRIGSHAATLSRIPSRLLGREARRQRFATGAVARWRAGGAVRQRSAQLPMVCNCDRSIVANGLYPHTPDHHSARPSVSARLLSATLRKSSPPRVVCLRRGRSRFCSQSSGKRLCIILFRKRQVATF